MSSKVFAVAFTNHPFYWDTLFKQLYLNISEHGFGLCGTSLRLMGRGPSCTPKGPLYGPNEANFRGPLVKKDPPGSKSKVS